MNTDTVDVQSGEAQAAQVGEGAGIGARGIGVEAHPAAQPETDSFGQLTAAGAQLSGGYQLSANATLLRRLVLGDAFAPHLRLGGGEPPVYVFNNGRTYSDRRLYFIAPTAEELAELEELLARYVQAWPRPPAGYRAPWESGSGYPVAIIDRAAWMPGTVCSVQSWVEDLDFLMPESCYNIEAASAARTIAARIDLGGYWEEREWKAAAIEQIVPEAKSRWTALIRPT